MLLHSPLEHLDCSNSPDTVTVRSRLHTAGSSGQVGRIGLLVEKSLRPGGNCPGRLVVAGCSSSSAVSAARGYPLERRGRLPMS